MRQLRSCAYLSRRAPFAAAGCFAAALLAVSGCAESKSDSGSGSKPSGGPSPAAGSTSAPSGQSKPGGAAAADAQPAAPGLAVGTRAPDATVAGIDGSAVQLASLYKDGPIVLTFYRGGWCPFCTRALSAWHDKMDALNAAGGTFIALTPEKPELAAATRETAKGDYAVFSDGAFAAAKAFKVYFVVDDATKAKYQQYGLKVDQSNVSGTWELPAPATFVIDKGGVIRWAFADWDYKKRADPDEVVAAVKAITGRK